MEAVEEAKKLIEEIDSKKIQEVQVVKPEKNQKMSDLAKLNKTPNPYGANKTKRDPREIKCWNLYLKTVASGSPDAANSARKAGYAESCARNITQHPWFKKRLASLRRKDMIDKSEQVLEEILNLPNEIEIMVDGIPTGIKKIEPALINQKRTVAQFVVERLLSEKYAQKQKEEIKITQAVLIGKLNEIFK